METKLFYIGKRHNEQLEKPYFKDYGQLSKTVAKKKENVAYGSMVLESFETEEAYKARLEELIVQGYNVY